MKSIMLTYYYCQDRGNISHKGESVLAFGDLYDKYAKKGKKYAEVLARCKNSDYERRQKTVGEESDGASGLADLAQSHNLAREFYRKLYKKILIT